MVKPSKLLQKALKTKESRGWDKIYIKVDIHDTIIESDYESTIENLKFYPDAIECLTLLTLRKDVSLILWSSCSIAKLHAYQAEFQKHGHVVFDHFNENLEEKSNNYADFSKKTYFNMIIDDKAGWDPEEDWTELLNYLRHEN